MKTFEKSTGTVNVLAEYLDAGFSKKSYPAWVRKHFPVKIHVNPLMASSKTTFFISPKEMFKAVQGSQKYKVNAAKRDAWLSQAYIDLDMQYKLNFESILNTSLFKMCFSIMRNMEKFHNNINGMSYTMRKLTGISITKDKRSLFEHILMEIKSFDTSSPFWIDTNEALKICWHFGVEITANEMFNEFKELELLDASGGGTALNDERKCSINAVYLLIITKLWR